MRPPQELNIPSLPRPPVARIVLDTALALGLTVGLCDAAVDLAVRDPASPSAVSTWPVVGATSLAVVLLFGVLWALSWPLRLLRTPRTRDPAAWAIGLAAGMFVAALMPLVDCFRGEEPNLTSLVMPLPGALLVGVALYCGVRLVSGLSGFRSVARTTLVAVPVCAALGCTFLYLKRDWLGGSQMKQLGALAAAAALGALIAGILWYLRRRQPSTALLSFGLVTCVALGASQAWPRDHISPAAGQTGAIRNPRHVILIVVDTLRADHLSCYSEAAQATPTLDALARESLQFTCARAAAPFTFPSMSSILTGLSPTVHLGLHPSTALPRAVPTLAERMSEAGYLTGAIVRNPSLTPACRIDQGFDQFLFQREPAPPTALGELALRYVWPDKYLPQVGAAVQTRRASEWIEKNREKDFFLWVHYFDPHMAYGPPKEFLPQAPPPQRVGTHFADASRLRDGTFAPDQAEREWIRELYAGEVRYLDTEIAGLFETLRRLDLYDDALIVFTSDHGEELWEHEGFEHGHTMYDEVLRVPLLIKLPGAGSLRVPVDVPVSTESVTPTVLAVANLLRDPADFTSPPLVQRTSDGFATEAAPRPLVTSAMLYFEDRTAVVAEGFKYVRYHVSGREELFDLARDPGEQNNLAGRKDERLERGRALLQEHLDAAARQRERLGILGPEAATLDAETLRRLRGLGYVR